MRESTAGPTPLPAVALGRDLPVPELPEDVPEPRAASPSLGHTKHLRRKEYREHSICKPGVHFVRPPVVPATPSPPPEVQPRHVHERCEVDVDPPKRRRGRDELPRDGDVEARRLGERDP